MDTQQYNAALSTEDRQTCELLAREIDANLPEADNRVWHAHPVWFLDGNPVVGYSKLKNCVCPLFWCGQSFEEEGLKKEGSFKAAEVRYRSAMEVNAPDLKRWLKKARDIQWDCKNIVWRISFPAQENCRILLDSSYSQNRRVPLPLPEYSPFHPMICRSLPQLAGLPATSLHAAARLDISKASRGSAAFDTVNDELDCNAAGHTD